MVRAALSGECNLHIVRPDGLEKPAARFRRISADELMRSEDLCGWMLGNFESVPAANLAALQGKNSTKQVASCVRLGFVVSLARGATAGIRNDAA